MDALSPFTRLKHDRARGRVRLAVRGLRHDAVLAARLEAAIGRQPGVEHVRASIWSGSVVVGFRAPATADRLRALIERWLAAPSPDADAGNPGGNRCGGAPRGNAGGNPGGGASGGNPGHAGGAEETAWHCAPVAAVAERFGTSPTAGLSEAAAAAALARYGANVVPEPPGPSRLALLWAQVATFPVALLAASAVLSIATGGLADAVAIAVVVGVNAAIGFVTERDADRTIRTLGRLEEGTVTVVRDGRERQVPAGLVVPGDLLRLAVGMAIAADARVVAADALTVDESPLTGESVPVTKTAETLAHAQIALADRRNMVFKGTAVVSGQGSAIVVATGSATEIGRIEMLATHAAPPTTTLQRQLDHMGRQLVWLSLAACGLTLVLGLLRGRATIEMLRSSVSLAVAAVPEGLPTVATVTLALGINKMRRHQAVIRRMQAVETLGSVTVVCFDKTGTLTENRMRAAKVLLAGETGAAIPVAEGGPVAAGGGLAEHPVGRRLLEVCVLCSDAEIEGGAEDGERLVGSATEQALLRLALDCGLDVRRLRQRYPLVATGYRAPGRDYMATSHRRGDGEERVAVKGNPEDVLALCRDEAAGEGVRPLTAERRARLRRANEQLAGEGLRVLGFADGPDRAHLSWLGAVGLADPIRPNLKALMGVFHGAGVRTVLITGDQSATAFAVARALDLSGGDEIEILEGIQLDGADAAALGALARRTHVFARVSPANKLAIVRALQREGDAVAMTGDGINDGPALRAADIGVTLGSATPLAHQLSDLVLADDRLETMAVALREGRTIYRNIRKAIRFLLATNLSEILVMLAATGLNLGQPLTPPQLLWINIVSDVFPGLGLAVDPADPDVLRVPPRPTDAPLFARQDFLVMAREGAVISLGALAATLLAGGGRTPQAAGRGFLALTIGQLLHALAGRDERGTILDQRGRPPNPRLSLAVAALLLAQGVALVLPPLRRLLGLEGLRLADLGIVGAASLGAFAANQAIRAVGADRQTTSPPPEHAVPR